MHWWIFAWAKRSFLYHFLQWYVAEQHEEEKLFRLILDKIDLLGPDDSRGLYWIDRELGAIMQAHSWEMNTGINGIVISN